MYDLGLVPIICKVRWGRKAKDGYVHGVSIQNINDEQRGLMCYELRQLISKVAKQLAKEQKAPNIVSNPKPGTHLQHNSRNPPNPPWESKRRAFAYLEVEVGDGPRVSLRFYA